MRVHVRNHRYIFGKTSGFLFHSFLLCLLLLTFFIFFFISTLSILTIHLYIVLNGCDKTACTYIPDKHILSFSRWGEGLEGYIGRRELGGI